MKSPCLVATARRATISKLFALLLVVLVALPFTAPFASFSPADVAGEGAEGAASLAKTSEKATASCFVDPVVASVRSSSAPEMPVYGRPGDVSQILPAVLRL